MKAIYIFKSEMDNSIYTCTDEQLNTFNKKVNKDIRIRPDLIIKPWQQIGRFEFQIEQAAKEFDAFLKTKAGIDFAHRYLFLNPLAELKKLIAVLPKSCEFYVMGGLALDGHYGKLSRRHDDLDLICWRKDVAIFKKALKQMGYGVREKFTKDDARLLRILETDEENPAIEVKIIDEQPDDNFLFHVNTPGKQILPKKILGPKQVTLEGIKFPAISLQLISDLNKLGQQDLKRIKEENPKLYSVLGYKISNRNSDQKLIRKLLKK